MLSISVCKDTDYLDNSCHCIVFCHRSFGSSGLKNPRVSPATLFLSRVAVAIALFLVSVFFTLFSGRKSMQSLNNLNIYLNLHTHPTRCKCDMFGFFRKTSLFHWVNNSVFLASLRGIIESSTPSYDQLTTPKKTEFRRRAATESVTRVDFAMVENDDVAQRWTPRHAGTERKLLGRKLQLILTWRLYLSVSTFKPYITHLKRLERWCFPPM